MSAIIALLLMQAASSESKVYPSSSGFRVAMAGGSCYLTAVYEGGIETTIFTDETNRVGFIFNQKDWNPVAGKRYKFKVDFGDEYYDLTTTAMENGGFAVSLHPGFLDSYAKASGVDISWGSKSIASLTLVGSSKSIASLRLCMKDEGIVLPAPVTSVVPPANVPRDPFDRSEPATIRYYSGGGYPVEANGAEGAVKATIKVGADGKLLECTVLESSGSAILDEAFCKGLRRSSFKAAKDRAGQPIESVFERSIRFEDPSKTVEPD